MTSIPEKRGKSRFGVIFFEYIPGFEAKFVYNLEIKHIYYVKF